MQNALRLWWDAADVLKPKVSRPEVWAAGVAYAWHHWASHDDATQAEVAEAFGVSAPTVGSRAREISHALLLDLLDDRYASPFDPRVRTARMLAYLRPDREQDFNDPIWAFGRQNPAGLAVAQRLNREAQLLIDQGKLKAARAKCREALDHCPVLVPARNNLAAIALLEEDPATVIREAEPGLQTHPEYVYTLAILARAHHRLGQPKQAQQRLNQALAVYRRWQTEWPEYIQQERASDRTGLWEALAELGEDGTLYELALRENLSTCSTVDLLRAAVAAERSGHRKRAAEWLRLRDSKTNPNWRLAGALATALEQIEAGAVPAFHLNYDFTLDSLKPGSTDLGPSARAVITQAIWGQDEKDAQEQCRALSIFRDPWVVHLLRAVLLRPELSPRRKSAAISSLVALGVLRHGDQVLIYQDGVLQTAQVNLMKE